MKQKYGTVVIETAGNEGLSGSELLTAECLQFVGDLCETFMDTRNRLLEQRKAVQEKIDAGVLPDFPEETEGIRKSEWKISPVPEFLQDRRVEITGPSGDRKMFINALNSGANVYMTDFEDAQSPTWEGILQGQKNIYDAVRKNLSYTTEDGKEYTMAESTATLFVRPRGLHLDEVHVKYRGTPVPGSFFDFAVFMFSNARKLVEDGLAPCLYIPKTESRFEAKLWNDMFSYAENYLGLEKGTVKATFLIETILAAFEMDEILCETRDHSAGLNCGRWDYIFSYIKKFRNNPGFVLPDRSSVTMDKGFLLAYTRLLVGTCHKRGAHAMGGMSAFIPVKGDEALNRLAIEKVREDKEREVYLGHDGTWVAHPALVYPAKDVFDRNMKGRNQLERSPDWPTVKAGELLSPIAGSITEEGLKHNVRVGIQYMDAWLGGRGAVPLYNLMEDAATAEISRSQVWQWIRHGSRLEDGRTVTLDLVNRVIDEEAGKLHDAGHLKDAVRLFREITADREFADFLTLKAYERLMELEAVE